METWEIEKVDEMTESEQKEYYEKMVDAYNKELAALKEAKKKTDKSAIAACSWRATLIAGAVMVIAGPLMAAFGVGAVNTIGEITTATSLGMFGGGMVGSILVNDEGPKGIKKDLLASKDAREKIKGLKAKIKEVKKPTTKR